MKSGTPLEFVRAHYVASIDSYISRGFSPFATDASCTDFATGCAVYDIARDKFHLYKFSRKFSSLTGELIAIRNAVRVAIGESLTRLVIFTDSRNSCHLLRSCATHNYLVHEIHRLIEDSIIVRLDIVWVPSHTGISFNERVDYMAKKATTIGTPSEALLPHSEAVRDIRNILRCQWNEQFAERSRFTGSFFFSLYPRIPDRPWFVRSTLAPRSIKAINRLFTGHSYDTVYLHMIGRSVSDQCSLCGVADSAEHIIFHCTKYRELRRRHVFFSEFSNLFTLLNSHNIDIFSKLADFILEADLADII